MSFHDRPRECVAAGRFYPDDATNLREQVEACLALQPPKELDLEGKLPLAVMLPHAGYMFSGSVAGMTLGRINLPDNLLVLGPNHTGRGIPFSVWSGGDWKTPLGLMSVDVDAGRALVDAGVGFAPDMAAHVQEHSIEVLAPFFQVQNPAARMTPIIVGGERIEALRAAGEALATLVSASAAAGERTLLVVSSDMSHYLTHDEATACDARALQALAALDAEAFFSVVRKHNISMCGVYPMTVALFALAKLGVSQADVVAYATSGQTGRAFGADMNRVVGYAGVVFS